jgi:hypothetical protein
MFFYVFFGIFYNWGVGQNLRACPQGDGQKPPRFPDEQCKGTSENPDWVFQRFRANVYAPRQKRLNAMIGY